MTTDYISFIRQQVGHQPVILVFAGGVLVNEQQQVLLQKRTDFNQWGLIGGALEFGETAEQACVREYQEETGLQVAVQSLMGVSSGHVQRYPNGDIAQTVVIEFVVKAIGGHLNAFNKETAALAYFDAAHLPPIFNTQHRQSIQRYYAGAYPYFD